MDVKLLMGSIVPVAMRKPWCKVARLMRRQKHHSRC
jgi:hypothetical protein